MKRLKVACVSMSLLSFVQIHAEESKVETQVSAEKESPTSKNTNITLNPLALLGGALNTAAAFKFSERSALGPTLMMGHRRHRRSGPSMFSIGFQSIFFLSNSAFTNGWTLTPSIRYTHARLKGSTANGIGLGALGGYAWFWPCGFNMGVGAGLQYDSIKYDRPRLDSWLGIHPAAEFNLGWNF